MELLIKLTSHNKYPLSGILIKGQSALYWAQEMQRMGISPESVQVFVLPGMEPNSVWGCLLEGRLAKQLDLGANMPCQLANNLLYLPEHSDLFPKCTEEELRRLFLNKKHIFHPDFGWAELSESVDWSTLLASPKMLETTVSRPENAPFVPQGIRLFQVFPLNKEDVLENLEKTVFPAHEKMEDNPLNVFEKVKLNLLKQLLKEGNKAASNTNDSVMGKLKGLLFSKESEFANSLRQDLEELERRNQKHLDRLLDMLKNDPEEALKFAIPLDREGTGRGGSNSELSLGKRWFDISRFDAWNGQSRNNLRASGGGSALPPEGFTQLEDQYKRTAEDLIKRKEHLKAAFVYMKLLKNHLLAAQTLENGKHFSEAAAVYLNFVNNKLKAAECYEKGNMFSEAIDLYKELHLNEKAGDLYLRINQKKAAFDQYLLVVEQYKQSHQYVKASLLCKKKMGDESLCQDLLLKGWRSGHDAFNCLNNYFANIREDKILMEQIEKIYACDVNEQNRAPFLKVLQHEFEKNNTLSAPIKNIAYEIIVAQVPKNPLVVHELKVFNKENKQLEKDAMRFRP